MIRYDQMYLADPTRSDGHNAAGRAGDCLRAAAATVLQIDWTRLHHYAEHESWWPAMRLDARRLVDLDWACTTPELLAGDYGWDIPSGYLMIACGPSPRGPWLHCVVVDDDLDLVHDPHPDRTGIGPIVDLLIPVAKYDPAPPLCAITT